MNNYLKHFKKICIHKYYVMVYCFMAGLYWRGIKHDLSKFHPIEFFESVKYYNDNESPIEACKKEKKYSKAWIHHQNFNSHHFEHYIMRTDNTIVICKMPFYDALELICDWLGAGKAYHGKHFSFEDEWEWWEKNKILKKLMHPHTKEFVERVFYDIKERNNCSILSETNYLCNIYYNYCEPKEPIVIDLKGMIGD